MLKLMLLWGLVALSTQYPSGEVPTQSEPLEEVGENRTADIVTTELAESNEPANAYDQYEHYQFSVDVKDGISDLTQSRTEVRDGTKVTGSYSYSDGYTKRTVYYEADEYGFRVIRQEEVPLNPEGPKVNLNGVATVQENIEGRSLKYAIQSVPRNGTVPEIKDA